MRRCLWRAVFRGCVVVGTKENRMAKLELPIKHTYVPSWGLWEGVREIVQNGLDEQQQNYHTLTVEHSDRTEVLTVRNEGASMDTRVLLLGETSKTANRELRGQFGEGLNLALLALARAGHAVKVITPTEIWEPSLGRSEVYNERVLMVNVRKRPKIGTDVTVTIGNVSGEEWAQLKPRFLALGEYNKLPGGYYGDVLTDEHYRGMVFVKGIFVMKHDDPGYGYDLHTAETDRDRNMIAAHTLKYELKNTLLGAAEYSQEEFTRELFNGLLEGTKSTQEFNEYDGSQAFRERIAALFREKFGEDAHPAKDLAECRELEHVGKRGVVVPSALRLMLQRQFTSVEKLKSELGAQVKHRYAWADLTLEERKVLEDGCDFVENAEVALGHDATGLFDRVDIVDFHGDVVGLAQDERLCIARHALTGLPDFLEILIHEEAHALSRAGDGTQQHTSKLESLWRVVVGELLG